MTIRTPRATWTSATLLVFALCSSPVCAGVRPGVEIGINYSTLHYEEHFFLMDSWDPGWRTSFTGGVTLEAPFGKQLSLMTGVRYVEQGNRVEVFLPDPFPYLVEFQIVQEYVSVPVLLGFRPFSSRRWFVSAGPEIGFLTAAHTSFDYQVPPAPGQRQGIQDTLESTNLSLDVMVGYEFPAGSHAGVASVRYTHGLVGVADEDQWATQWKTRGVEALLGMRW